MGSREVSTDVSGAHGSVFPEAREGVRRPERLFKKEKGATVGLCWVLSNRIKPGCVRFGGGKNFLQ